MTSCNSALPYQTATWLNSNTEDSMRPRHWVATLGEAANERLVARKLGVNGFKRWQYFRQHFSGRWGDEGQNPVSPRSQEALLKALESLDFPPTAKPSLFLTDDGYFELAWRDDDGPSVQLEFGPAEFELFMEATGVEESHPHRQMAEVIAKHLAPK